MPQHLQGTDRGPSPPPPPPPKGSAPIAKHYISSKCTGHIWNEYRKLAKDKEKSKQKERKGRGEVAGLAATAGAGGSSGTVSTPHSPTFIPPFTCGTSAVCYVTSSPSSTHTPSTGWTYDPGASSHMTNNLDLVLNIRNFDKRTGYANGAISHAARAGTVAIQGNLLFHCNPSKRPLCTAIGWRFILVVSCLGLGFVKVGMGSGVFIGKGSILT